VTSVLIVDDQELIRTGAGAPRSRHRDPWVRRQWCEAVELTRKVDRDLFAGLMGDMAEPTGMTTEAERHVRDVYDHLIRISDLIDTYCDLLTSSMDVFLSTVSNRLNVVMKQLAVIATIFLPPSFLTGYLGQNFGWLARNIAGWPAFAVVGIGTQVVTVAILMTSFRRRGWF
jgi:magnesium transporter